MNWLLLSLALAPAISQAKITVDGVLDEPEWQQATVYKEFVTTEPLTSAPAKYHTEVRVLSNAEGIFIGFSNFQPSDVTSVYRRFARDAEIKGDRNTVAIDFDGNGLAGYDFTVGSANSIQDGIFSANNWSSDWDGTWYSQTSKNDSYWYSEIHIPWSVAPMSKTNHGIKTMTMWFSRVVYGESLRFAYPNAASQRNTFVQDWLPIDIKQEGNASLEWFPYISYNNDLHGDETEWNTGLDVVWRPDSNTQVTGAINPDFGQVESDDLVINFSAFETLQTEKRPFFTENQSLFTNQMPADNSMVHTRRIGAGSDANDYESNSIDVAAKISHYGDSSDVGIFAVFENDTSDSEGRDFFSSRIQSQFNGLSLGHRLTYVDRPSLERNAMVNALDFDMQHAASRFKGELLYSDIQQSATDLDPQYIDEQGYAGWLEWRYSPNDNWNQLAQVFHYGDKFEMNDLGFMQRNDLTEFFGETQHDTLSYPSDSSMLSSYTALRYGYQENTHGDRLGIWGEIEQGYIFNSTRELFMNIGAEPPSYDDRITRGNGLYYRPTQLWGAIKYQSIKSDDFSFFTRLSATNYGTDAFTSGIEIEPQFYATETLTLSSNISYKFINEWLLWEFDQQQLATYQAKQLITDLRMDWYPTSKQEVRLKFQWVSITADALGGFNLSPSGRLMDSGSQISDFTVSDTALQIRYRYQLAPLSDIFLVYSRGGYFSEDRRDESTFSLLNEGWDEKQAENIIAKIRYRF